MTESRTINPTKFCFGCQKMKSITQGQNVIRNKTNRWICNVCLARKNKSDFAKQKEVK